MLAIMECVCCSNENDYCGKMTVPTDSRTAMGTLSERSVKTRTDLSYKGEINIYSSRGRLILVWVSTNSGVEGNVEPFSRL